VRAAKLAVVPRTETRGDTAAAHVSAN